jgi:hypothetical protein
LAPQELFRHFEVIIFEHDDVSKLACFQRSDLTVSAQKLGAVGGNGAEGGFARETLAWESAVVGRALGCGRVGVFGVAASGYTDFEGEELVEGVNLSRLLDAIAVCSD